VLDLAQEEARLLNHNFIGTEHILLGLIHEGEGLAAKALESLGISLEAAREKVEETIGPRSVPTGDSPRFTPRAKKVLELSLREALQLGHNYIGTEHILLGLVREREGVGAQVLVSLGADLPRVRQQVIQLLSGYQGRVGFTGLRPPGTAARQRPTESSPVPISDGWTIQVVRAGRTPAVFADAYQRMERLVTEHGVDLDELRITVTSVDTNEGPGLRLVVSYATADDAATSPWDRHEEASGDEPPV
jgi:ATP-dependent Clp protease ATP-binding subunit ClpA